MSRLRTVRFLWGVGLTSLLLLVLKFMMDRPTESDSVAYLEEKDLPGASTALHGPVLGRARTALITKPPIINRTAESQEPKCPQQKHIEPWFRLPDDRTETYLVFYGKPIMQILRTITSLRGWKMKLILRDSPEGLEELQGLVALDRLLVVFTTSKSFHHKLLRALANSTNVLIGSIENAFKVTGAKRAQLTVFRNHFQSFGCSLEDAAIMPRSFILDDPMECIQFFKYGNTHPQSWWVLKPSNGQGGDGISIHSNLTALYSKYATCMKKSDSIIQEYVLSPLLLQNRKFDIRAFILIAQTSPYYLLFYHEGYLRVSVKEFDLHGGREAHLTNSHVQIAVEGFSMSEHFWSFQRLQEYLNEHLPVENEDFVSSRLIPFIKKVGLFILQSAKPVFTRAPSNFLMMGLDFMVTTDLRIQFIEANNYPLWPKGTDSLNKMMHKMGDDLFNLLLDCRRHPDWFQDMHPGDMYGTWTLVWNELLAQCSDTPPYDACNLFVQ